MPIENTIFVWCAEVFLITTKQIKIIYIKTVFFFFFKFGVKFDLTITEIMYSLLMLIINPLLPSVSNMARFIKTSIIK